MKKIFAFAVLFAAMSLVACGGEQPKAEEAEDVAVEEVVVEEAPAAPAAPAVKAEKAETPSVNVEELTVSKPLDVKVEAAVVEQDNKPTVTKELKPAKKPMQINTKKDTKLQVQGTNEKNLQVGTKLGVTPVETK
ncbi:MAG: hypothetical protein IKJ20_01370 [Alistipes sp.]|nr:hypothetical protein [Alistipes sp.]